MDKRQGSKAIDNGSQYRDCHSWHGILEHHLGPQEALAGVPVVILRLSVRKLVEVVDVKTDPPQIGIVKDMLGILMVAFCPIAGRQ